MRVLTSLVLAGTCLTTAAAALAEPLTLERITASPALSGPGARNVKFSPDGERVTFLRGRVDDQFQLDLWEYNFRDNVTRRLVDSSIVGGNAVISDAEKARRERARTAALHGILEYSWAADGQRLLVPIGGDLYLVDVSQTPRARKIASGNVLDPKISPKGRFVSFIRAQNLFVIEIASGKETQLTFDGGGAIHNAEAEFVAQEEMHQSSGYWWAPDDSAIAFKRFDESPVPVARRFEIYADRTEVVEQRYPGAGQKNVLVSLAIVSPAGGAPRTVDLGPERDIYLVRADWTSDSTQLVYQRESRDQHRLDLIAVDAGSLAQRTLLSETSATWIDLNDDLRFLKSGKGFVWASERSGRKHLYLYDLNGKLLHPISSGEWGIDNLLAVDEEAGRVYVAANKDAVIDKQVYALALDGSAPAAPIRITRADGWHEVAFGRKGKAFIDTWSDPETPPQVSVRGLDDAPIAWIEHNELNASHPYAPYASSHVPVSYGSLQAADGQTLYYSMLKPLGFDPAKRYPVFVQVYGGPGVQSVARKWGGHFEQYMAQQGYVVFKLDNRGSARRERKFTDVIYKTLGQHEVQDQLTGIDWLARQSFVDPKRIGVFGWSYGGFMTLRLLAAGSDKIAAGVSGAPVTDWSLYDTHYTERFIGTPQANAGGYAQSAVFAHLDGLRSPLFLIHGMADDNVLFTNSTRLIDALVKRGVLFDLMTYPGAKHGVSGSVNQLHVFRKMDAFFRQHLKDVPLSPPTKG
jgi:dipeptidyl-peptidase-4